MNRIAHLAALALLATATLAQQHAHHSYAATAHSHAAQADQTYTSPAYTLRAPAGWAPLPGQTPGTLTIASPDRNAFASIAAEPARTAQPVSLPQILTAVIGTGGTILTAPTYGQATVHGVRIEGASAAVQFANHRHAGIIMITVVTTRRYRTIAAAGVVDTGTLPSSPGAQEAHQAEAILRGVTYR